MPEETQPEPANHLYDNRLPRYSLWRRMQIPVIAAAATAVIRTIGPTLRFETVGPRPYDEYSARGEPLIAAFWHRCVIPAVWYWRNRKIAVLHTANFDGQWAGRVLEHFGHSTAQGSSSRGGLRGLADMAQHLKEGRDAIFTVDGPRGPRYVAKPGPVMLARQTGTPIFVFHIGLESAHTLEKAWDKMQIPHLFSRGVMVGGPLIHVAPDANAEELERKHAEMQKALERVRDVAESWFKLSEAGRARLRAEWNAG